MRDGDRRELVVARDHHGAHLRLGARADRLLHPDARRIDHPDEPEEREALLEVRAVVLALSLLLIEVAASPPRERGAPRCSSARPRQDDPRPLRFVERRSRRCAVAISAQSGRSTSALPLVWTTSRPLASSVTIVMRFRSLSNGSSFTTWCAGAIDSRGTPPFAASVRSAASVGSPVIFHFPSSVCSSVALLQSATVASSWLSGSRGDGDLLCLPRVDDVPVGGVARCRSRGSARRP